MSNVVVPIVPLQGVLCSSGLRTHPIHARRDEDVAPTLIPVPQAIAMEMETIEDLEKRLAIANHNLQVLRDEA